MLEALNVAELTEEPLDEGDLRGVFQDGLEKAGRGEREIEYLKFFTLHFSSNNRRSSSVGEASLLDSSSPINFLRFYHFTIEDTLRSISGFFRFLLYSH
jgi:hypothetical protein